MNDIELRKWCLEKTLAFIANTDDTATDAINISEIFYNWINERQQYERMKLDHSQLNIQFEDYNKSLEEHIEVHENIMNKLGILPVDEFPKKLKPYQLKPDLGFDPILLARIDEDIIEGTFPIDNLSNIIYLGDLVTAKAIYYKSDPSKHISGFYQLAVNGDLEKYALELGMIIPNWPPENIEELRELYKDEIEARLKNE